MLVINPASSKDQISKNRASVGKIDMVQRQYAHDDGHEVKFINA